MRTNIVIYDKLMSDALQAAGMTTKREAVELGFKLLVRKNKQQAIRKLSGKLKWQGDLGELRGLQVILADTSVWIDYFNGTETEESNALGTALADGAVAIGDIILLEILQGFNSEKDYNSAKIV